MLWKVREGVEMAGVRHGKDKGFQLTVSSGLLQVLGVQLKLVCLSNSDEICQFILNWKTKSTFGYGG